MAILSLLAVGTPWMLLGKILPIEAATPQCRDGADNDGDGKIDFGGKFTGTVTAVTVTPKEGVRYSRAVTPGETLSITDISGVFAYWSNQITLPCNQVYLNTVPTAIYKAPPGIGNFLVKFVTAQGTLISSAPMPNLQGGTVVPANASKMEITFPDESGKHDDNLGSCSFNIRQSTGGNFIPADPECSSPDDDSEAPAAQCSDGIDNDGDGATDMNDFSCSSPTDNDETNPKSACQDGVDNDADGLTDFPQDPGCSSRQDNDEKNPGGAQCDDGKDNDGDGKIDLQDPGCTGPTDTDETDLKGRLDITKTVSPTSTAGQNVTYNFTIRNIGQATVIGANAFDFFIDNATGQRIDPPFSFVSSNGANCTFVPAEKYFLCPIGDLAANQTKTFTMTFAVPANNQSLCNASIMNQVDVWPGDNDLTIGDWDKAQTTISCPASSSSSSSSISSFISSSSSSSSRPQCSDNVDNDGDGKIDYFDPGCYNNGFYDPDDDDEQETASSSSSSTSSSNVSSSSSSNISFSSSSSSFSKPECSDHIDNDNDSKIDYFDPGCYNNGFYDPDDDDEQDHQASSSSSSSPINSSSSSTSNISSSPLSSAGQTGCINILKETFTPNGDPITTVPQFSFKLDSDGTVSNNASGFAQFTNVSVGTHTVTEITIEGWEQILVTPSNGQVNVEAGNNCAGIIFKNRQESPGASSSSFQHSSVSSSPGSSSSSSSDHHSSSSSSSSKEHESSSSSSSKDHDSSNSSTKTSSSFSADHESSDSSSSKSSTPTVSSSSSKEHESSSSSTKTSSSKHSSVSSVPLYGCIEIFKEALNPKGKLITTVPQFTFKLDNDGTVTNDSNGKAKLQNIPAGLHTITEHLPNGWQQLNVTPSDGKVFVTPGNNCAGIVFKNRQVIAPQCSDSIDNDNDGKTDYPHDPGCKDAGDNNEKNENNGNNGHDNNNHGDGSQNVHINSNSNSNVNVNINAHSGNNINVNQQGGDKQSANIESNSNTNVNADVDSNAWNNIGVRQQGWWQADQNADINANNNAVADGGINTNKIGGTYLNQSGSEGQNTWIDATQGGDATVDAGTDAGTDLTIDQEVQGDQQAAIARLASARKNGKALFIPNDAASLPMAVLVSFFSLGLIGIGSIGRRLFM